MDFTLDETQEEIRGLTAEVLRREVRPDPADATSAVPRAWAEDPGYHEAAWKAMGAAGLLGLALPADLGGEGLGVLETAVLLTEVGRHAAPVPALATLALGVLPVTRLGTPTQQEALLPPVATGERVLTAALREPSDPLPASPRTTAHPDGGTLVVTGTKVGVPHAAAAHRVLVPASLGGDTAVLLVDPRAAGVALTRTPTASGAPEYTLRLDDARVPEADLLGGGTGGVADLYRLAVAGACAVGSGVLAGALALTAEHVRTRHQFGKPLATFQAVAAQVADVYVTERTLHLATSSACWALAAGRDHTREELDVAAYWLAEEAPPALHTCHHLHGGLGVDVTYPMHRYSSWAKDLARFVGGASHRLDRLATAVTG
ncbi:acyl-CoA dehydrogenase family protein [Gandjariella thermophila]|uniref:Acyl-CoA dehydrogenase n=1 Tax=Gandjariella thermophila TaxID=1931992 RepID=A0A4D4IXN6_9PSEU|nr:acyl-CoA dehydrogenase family protein [Gandjariella thermophila]GDY28981.1 acyl-CoA dehydrogenase [Gandjariella thermophila]